MAKFRLERIIEIKNKIMDDKKKDLERALSALENVNDLIDSLETEIGENHRTMTVSPMTGTDFSVLRDFLFSLEQKKERLVEERHHMNETLETIKAELFELAKEMKMLEPLRSKAYREEKKSLNRKEQKIMDAIALRSEES